MNITQKDAIKLLQQGDDGDSILNWLDHVETLTSLFNIENDEMTVETSEIEDSLNENDVVTNNELFDDLNPTGDMLEEEEITI